MRGLVVLGAVLALASPARASLYQQRDLLGETYQAATFAPCQEWGCREVSRSPQGITLALRRLDVRLKLSLSPTGRVMGIEAVAPADAALGSYWSRLTRQAFGQTFSKEQFAACFAGIAGGQGQRLLHGGGGEHYGVQCFRRPGMQGIRIYFDW